MTLLEKVMEVEQLNSEEIKSTIAKDCPCKYEYLKTGDDVFICQYRGKCEECWNREHIEIQSLRNMKVKEIKKLDNGTPFGIEVRNEYNNLKIDMKWDGCVNIRKYYNGDTPEENTSENVSYMHICELKEFISELQEALDIAKEVFGDETFEEYYE